MPAGAEVDACIGSDWKLHLEHMEVLVWPIQANGGYGEAWTVITRKCWSAFWCNCRCREWRELGMRRRLILLARAVEPLIRWYLGIVPTSKSRVDRLDSLQRHMVGLILDLPKHQNEACQDYVGRHSRQASQAITASARWWSTMWIESSKTWLGHSQRDYERQIGDTRVDTSFIFCSILLRHRDAA